MGKRILGLDLGTNSIGWAVVDELGSGEFDLVKRGVHIFQEGVKIEKGHESSRASERSGYRAARRIKFRRKLRKIETLKVLSSAGYCPPLTIDELKAWQSKKIYPQNVAFREWCRTSDPKDKDAGVFKNPYYFRWLAATTTLNLADEADRFTLGRAFYHMAQRRGFKSNRLDKTTENADGIVTKDISELSEKMDGRTLGQYFWEECYRQGTKIRRVHTSRDEHYLAEFEFICEKQGISDELKAEFHRAIFYQRPLKSQKGLVASCPFEPKKKRVPISHPQFEEFRLWQTLNNIKIKTQNDAQFRPLSAEEKEIIWPLFFRVSKPNFDFKDVAKALLKTLNPKKQKHAYVKARDAAEAQVLFNYRDNQSLAGCPFLARLKNQFGPDYKQYLFRSYCGHLENKSGEKKTADDILHEAWHVLFSFSDQKNIREYAKGKLGLSEEKAGQFAAISPLQGYGALSLKAVRKILPFLKQGLLYSHAVFFANLDQVVELSDNQLERVRSKIAELIDAHNHYVAEARCVNDFVRDYKVSPQAFEETYDLRNVQDFETRLPMVLRSSVESIWKQLRSQILKNNRNGEYLPVKRLDDRIADYLMEEFSVDAEALERLYHPSAIETYKPAKKHSDGKYYLGDPRISSIRNPVFMRAMHRVKAVVNELLKQGIITDQTQVHIEMAREMNDANKRAAINTWQRINKKKRQNYKKAIEEDLKGQRIVREATKDEILKYQLWEEQNHICPYTGVTIKPSDFIGENPSFDIEHTIPRSQSYDNSQENKTLCDRNYNRNVKKNRIPFDCPDYQQILQRIEHWHVRVEELCDLIEKQRPKSKFATTKEVRDGAIQKRLVLEYERNYLREKYRRFTMDEVTSGFKNSQLVDTRIITKYTRFYLQTVFSTIHTVNGKTTDDFRRCWGVKKSRDHHAHHTVDAIVVACATRAQYDKLALYYHEYESYELNASSVPVKPHFQKPWKTFTEDMKNLKKEILVSHFAPNNLLKQTKKRAKVRGKTVIQQGKTARGSLHQETFYGAIQRVEKNKKGEVKEVVRYVVRKPLDELAESDLKKIVDDRVREIVISARKNEVKIKKEMAFLREKISKCDELEECVVKQKIQSLEKSINFLYVLPNKNGSPVPIKKVRIYTKVTNPIPLKKQKNISSKSSKAYKESYWVNNEDNFCISVYEGFDHGGRRVRSFRVFNNYTATNDSAESGDITFSKRHDVFEKKGCLLTCRYEMKPGTPVLFCDKCDLEQMRCLCPEDLSRRLYYMYGIKGDDGRSKFRFHQEARLDKDQESPVSLLDVQCPASKLWISASKLNVLVGGVDFKINILGEIGFLEK